MSGDSQCSRFRFAPAYNHICDDWADRQPTIEIVDASGAPVVSEAPEADDPGDPTGATSGIKTGRVLAGRNVQTLRKVVGGLKALCDDAGIDFATLMEEPPATVPTPTQASGDKSAPAPMTPFDLALWSGLRGLARKS